MIVSFLVLLLFSWIRPALLDGQCGPQREIEQKAKTVGDQGEDDGQRPDQIGEQIETAGNAGADATKNVVPCVAFDAEIVGRDKTNGQ
jgi:hypothetical protein